MKGYYALVIAQLKLHGFRYLKNSKGSHEIWSNDSLHVTVPFNCASRHTANGIMKACGIKQRF